MGLGSRLGGQSLMSDTECETVATVQRAEELSEDGTDAQDLEHEICVLPRNCVSTQHSSCGLPLPGYAALPT